MDSQDPHWIQCFSDFQIGDGYNFDTMEKTHAIIDSIEQDSLKFHEDRVIKTHQFTGHVNERGNQKNSSEGFVRLKAKVLDLKIPGLTVGGGGEVTWEGSGEKTTEDDVTTLHLSVRMQTGIARLNDRRRGSVTRSHGARPTHYVSALSYGGYLDIDVTVRMKSRKEKTEFERKIGANLEATYKGYGGSAEANSKVKEIDDYLKRNEECTVNINSSVSELQYDTSESNPRNLNNLQGLINRFIEKVKEQNGGRGKPLLAKIAPLSELDRSVEQYQLENRLGSQIKDLEDWYDDICTALSLLRAFFQFMEDRQGAVDFPDEIRHLERALRKLRDSFTETIQGLTHKYSDYGKNKEIIKNLERKYEEFCPTAVGTRRCIGKVKKVTGKYKKEADADEPLPGPYAAGTYTNLVAVGKMGTGKSSTCNLVVEKEGVFEAARSARGVTKDLSAHCTTVGTRKLRLIDTPGLLEAISSVDQLDLLQKLSHCVSMLEGDTGIDAFMFVIRCDEPPSQEELGAVVQLATLFSESIFEYMIVVATHKDELENYGRSTEDFRKNLPDQMKTILQKAGNRMVFINNVTRDPKTRRGYIKSIIKLVDEIAKNHSGKKFSHKCIENASAKREQLKTKNPNLSRVAIQQMLEEETSRYIKSSYWCWSIASQFAHKTEIRQQQHHVATDVKGSVLQQPPQEITDKGKTVSEYIDRTRKDMSRILKQNARDLAAKHSDLCRIYFKPGNGVDQKPCFVFCCSDKSKGQEDFPQDLDGYPVEVEEGFVELLADVERQPSPCTGMLYVGCEIRSKKIGSLGFFANFQPQGPSNNRSTGQKPSAFITCSHVIDPTNTDVFVKGTNGPIICGTVHKARAGYCKENQISVDAAIVSLNPAAKTELVARARDEKKVSFSNVLALDASELSDDEIVYKHGSKTGYTKGMFSSDCNFFQAKTMTDTNAISEYMYVDMITVKNCPEGKGPTDNPTGLIDFADQGDSGAAAYVMRYDENEKRKTPHIIGLVTCRYTKKISETESIKYFGLTKIIPTLEYLGARIYRPSTCDIVIDHPMCAENEDEPIVGAEGSNEPMDVAVEDEPMEATDCCLS